MCGIVGYSHISHRLPPEVLKRGLSSLSHRGPDHQGQFVSRNISLGATRLRILDLVEGDQPFFSTDRNVVVIFNGEIFNHRHLRAELEAEGFHFRTNCDTEVVLNAFLHWGTDCFFRLRGMYSIAVWVESDQTLVLARDPIGVKPLYYWLENGEICFASELKGIFAHPSVSRSLCLKGLNCFLSLNYVPGPYTLVEGILKLMPGHTLEWHRGTCTIRPFRARDPLPPPSSIEEACETLDALIDQSVSEQLVSDVPLGIWLSGGLDSSTILHYAARHHQSRLKTFSLTFKGRSFDDGSYARHVSRHYGAEHFECDLNPGTGLTNAIEQFSYYSDEPSADAGALPLWFLAAMSRKEVTVLLSGEGADELFAGYVTYLADRYNAVARHTPEFVRKTALACVARLPVSDEKISFEYKIKRFLQGSLLNPELAHVFWNGTFSESEKQRVFRYSDAQPLREIMANGTHSSRLAHALEFDQRYYLPDDILYKVDRISMAHSLEARPPFLDTRIVDFANSLPDHFKVRGSQTKYLLRRLMKDKLPKSTVQRPKVGLDIPVHDWLRGALKPLLLDTVCENAIAESGLFDWHIVEQLLQQHMERRANWGYHLWGLMILLMWMKRWRIDLPTEEKVLTGSSEDALVGV